MKTYEKLGIGIAVAALGFAAYQTYMTKNAVDQNRVVDSSRSPIAAAKENILNTVKGGGSWFYGMLGKGSDTAQDAKNQIEATVRGTYNMGAGTIQLFKDTGTSGLKYLYNKGADTGDALRESTGWFFTKSKSLMGNTYEAARSYIPKTSLSLGGLTGIFNKIKERIPLGK